MILKKLIFNSVLSNFALFLTSYIKYGEPSKRTCAYLETRVLCPSMAFIYLARSLGLRIKIPIGEDFDLSDDAAFFPDFVSKGTHEFRGLCG